MINNYRLAHDLVRVAKSLLSVDISLASEDGEYSNFTGNIKTDFIDGSVKNAYFVIEKGEITFLDGIWEKGLWKSGIFEDGIWLDGTWKNGAWSNGTWEKGLWENGTWYGGNWKNGNWQEGYDGKGKRHLDSPDNW